MIIHAHDTIEKGLMTVAEKMIIAATTAPKGRGDNNMEACIVTGETIREIAASLKAMGEALEIASFVRDAGNLEASPVMILLGTKIKPLGLKKCGMCGFPSCGEKEKHPDVPCVFNTGDLGIAIGSAVSVAADHRVNNRIMYTVGQAVKEMGLFSDEVKVIYAIPLSATKKNPFFDRK